MLVYKPYRKKGLSVKLLHRSTGPFIVLRQTGLSNYLVKRQGEEETHEVHVSAFKPYVARQPNDQEDSEESEYEETIPDDLLSSNPNPSTCDIEKSPAEKEKSTNRNSATAFNPTPDGVKEPVTC